MIFRHTCVLALLGMGVRDRAWAAAVAVRNSPNDLIHWGGDSRGSRGRDLAVKRLSRPITPPGATPPRPCPPLPPGPLMRAAAARAAKRRRA